MAMKAEIIAVGSELLTPDRLDTNSLFLTAELNQLGIEVLRKTIVGDDFERLRGAFREAMDRVELVVSCGGLGPTEDDLTREAVADILGRKLQQNAAVLSAIEARFRRMGRTMAAVNAKQAQVPEGATVLENPRGTAPGLWIEARDRVLVLLPGPPKELEGMVREHVVPRLARLSPSLRVYARELRVVGMPESDLDQRIAPIYKPHSEVQTTILAAPGEIQIHLRMWSSDSAAAGRLLDQLQSSIVMALGDAVFTTNGQSLEDVVARDLTLHHATIATAESCTGGLLAERLTRIAGSSAFFLGGAVCYGNAMKIAWAGVPPEMIESHGAVSGEVAAALAEGIRRNVGATLGVGITGVAGPAGGSPEKPVGTVHIGLASDSGTKTRALLLPGDRERIRWQASQIALDMVRRHFLRAARPAERDAAKG